MAANDFLYSQTISPFDLTVKNTEATTALAAGDVVKLDASNVVSGTQASIGVLQGTAAAQPLGVALEAITAGKVGRIRALGPIVQCVASGAVTAGVVVAAGATGLVAAQTSGQTQLGIALTATSNNGDKILVMLCGGKNA